jgi:ribosomal protein L32
MVFIYAVLLGLIPAYIAHNKGHNFFIWWIGGASMFIIALPWAILLKPNLEVLEKDKIKSGEMKKCPNCAELVKRDARICRFCGHEFYPQAKTINQEIKEYEKEKKVIQKRQNDYRDDIDNEEII